MPETTPGHGDGGGALDVAVVDHAGPGKQVGAAAVAGQGVVGGIELARRTHAVVDHLGAPLVGTPQHHAAARRRPAHPGLDHAQREGGRDRGIDRVAARGEHGGADLRRTPVLRRHHARLGGDHGLADDLCVGEVVHAHHPLAFAWRTTSACVANHTGAKALGVADQLVQDPDARAIAADVRMHGELEDAALPERRVEFAPEDVEHVGRRRVGPQSGEAVHVEVHRVVADPFHRQFDHAGRLRRRAAARSNRRRPSARSRTAGPCRARWPG